MTSLKSVAFIDKEIAERLMSDVGFRNRFIRVWAQTEVAEGIRTLRRKRNLKQKQVAVLANTGQSAISRMEKADYDGWTFKTLLTLAEVLRARLRVTFEPIEEIAIESKERCIPTGEQK
jgi:hypothetical protein